MYPKLSIITPSYNQAAYLEQTIHSVLDQGYPNLEYIIIDGGSTDGSVEIIQKYSHYLAYWVSEPDGGQSEAINKGFACATGEIVAWINSDDYYLPGTFFRVIEEVMSHPVDGIYSDCPIVDDTSRQIGCFKGDYFSLERLLEENMIPQPTVFLKRNVLDEVGLLDSRLHYVMDLDWWMRICISGKNLLYLPDSSFTCFRMTDFNKTTLFPQSFFDEIFDVYSRNFLHVPDLSIRNMAYVRLYIKQFFLYLREGDEGQQKDILLKFLEIASEQDVVLLASRLSCEDEVVFNKGYKIVLLIKNQKLRRLLAYYHCMHKTYEVYLKSDRRQFIFLSLRGFLLNPCRFLEDLGNIKRLMELSGWKSL